jgi:hypothetical protein
MSDTNHTPLCQWFVPGSLDDVSERLKAWQDRQPAALEIQPFEQERLDMEISFFLNNPTWGEFGIIYIEYVDLGQTKLSLYRPYYPTPEETSVFEPQIRAAVPEPGIALRLLDMFGPEKFLPYLVARLHERRLDGLESVRISLAYWFKAVANAPIQTVEDVPQFPISSPAENRSDPPNVPTVKKSRKRDIPCSNKSDTILIQLWSDGQSIKQIASQTGKTEKTILNRLSLLRKTQGEEVVPRRR